MGQARGNKSASIHLFNYLKISLQNFLNDLPGYDEATNTFENDINGWQIILIDGGGGLKGFQFSMIKKQGQVGTSKNATMSHYDHLSIIDILTDLPDPAPIGNGPFPEEKITSQPIDFYYLTKENLDMLLVNQPTQLYLSMSMINFGASISSPDNINFSLLKIECRSYDGPLIYTNRESTAFPLFVFAPPCPPSWNPIYRKIPGFENVQISAKTSSLNDYKA